MTQRSFPPLQPQESSTRAPSTSRRRLMTGSAAMAGVAALEVLGFPSMVYAQSDKIRIGLLTPRTGFLGPLGEDAVMGISLAVEEIHAAGVVLGRALELIAEHSVHPSTDSSTAQRLLGRPGQVVLTGEIP